MLGSPGSIYIQNWHGPGYRLGSADRRLRQKKHCLKLMKIDMLPHKFISLLFNSIVLKATLCYFVGDPGYAEVKGKLWNLIKILQKILSFLN